MVDGKSLITWAYEIQCMVKELVLLKIIVPGEFVARVLLSNCLLYREISPLLSNTRGAHIYFELDRLS
jgi:hypothetical protein